MPNAVTMMTAPAPKGPAAEAKPERKPASGTDFEDILSESETPDATTEEAEGETDTAENQEDSAGRDRVDLPAAEVPPQPITDAANRPDRDAAGQWVFARLAQTPDPAENTDTPPKTSLDTAAALPELPPQTQAPISEPAARPLAPEQAQGIVGTDGPKALPQQTGSIGSPADAVAARPSPVPQGRPLADGAKPAQPEKPVEPKAPDLQPESPIPPQPTRHATGLRTTPAIVAQIPVGPNPATPDPETDLDIVDELPLPQEGGTFRSHETGASPTTPLATARAEISRAVAGQMAAAITAKPGAGRIELALNPEELGKVSITMTGSDDGLHLVIAAERPETLDLMRRHIAILSAEFQDMGYDGLTFDLGMAGDPDQRESTSSGSSFVEAEQQVSALATDVSHPRTAPARALDLRL